MLDSPWLGNGLSGIAVLNRIIGLTFELARNAPRFKSPLNKNDHQDQSVRF